MVFVYFIAEKSALILRTPLVLKRPPKSSTNGQHDNRYMRFASPEPPNQCVLRIVIRVTRAL